MNVIALPVRPCVDQAWERYAGMCRQLATDPSLPSDPVFIEKLKAAEAEWCNLYLRWGKRA